MAKNKSNFKTRAEKNTNLLGVELKNYGECGWCLDLEETLTIPWSIWMEWKYISTMINSNEWGAVFWVENKIITKYKIPEQLISPAECEFKEELGGNGVVHSHNNMQVFHSSQDDKHARNLYEYSIVLNNAGSYVATKKVDLPCGGKGYVNLKLILSGTPSLEIEKIKERTETELESWKPDESEEDYPCVQCTTFRCHSCKEMFGQNDTTVGSELPFCTVCEVYDCEHCWKLKIYDDNYPDKTQETKPWQS